MDINLKIEFLKLAKRIRYIRDNLVMDCPSPESISDLYDELDDLLRDIEETTHD